MIRVGLDCEITLVFRDVFDSSSRNLVFFFVCAFAFCVHLSYHPLQFGSV